MLNFGSCKLCGTEVDIMILLIKWEYHENQLVIDFDHCTLNQTYDNLTKHMIGKRYTGMFPTTISD